MKTFGGFVFVPLLLLTLSYVRLGNSADTPPYDALSPTRSARNLPIADGFAALKWGVSIEEAHKTYSDLREDNSRLYNQYNKGGKDENVWLLRVKDNLNLGGHSMESIKYKFEKGKFVAVGLGVSCDQDTPCNIEVIYQDITKAMRTLYGKPHKIGSHTYEDEAMVRKRGGIVKTEEIEWKIDDESVNVSKSVEPNFSYISISIFSYQGYFLAIGQER